MTTCITTNIVFSDMTQEDKAHVENALRELGATYNGLYVDNDNNKLAIIIDNNEQERDAALMRELGNKLIASLVNASFKDAQIEKTAAFAFVTNRAMSLTNLLATDFQRRFSEFIPVPLQSAILSFVQRKEKIKERYQLYAMTRKANAERPKNRHGFDDEESNSHFNRSPFSHHFSSRGAENEYDNSDHFMMREMRSERLRIERQNERLERESNFRREIQAINQKLNIELEKQYIGIYKLISMFDSDKALHDSIANDWVEFLVKEQGDIEFTFVESERKFIQIKFAQIKPVDLFSYHHEDRLVDARIFLEAFDNGNRLGVYQLLTPSHEPFFSLKLMDSSVVAGSEKTFQQRINNILFQAGLSEGCIVISVSRGLKKEILQAKRDIDKMLSNGETSIVSNIRTLNVDVVDTNQKLLSTFSITKPENQVSLCELQKVVGEPSMTKPFLSSRARLSFSWLSQVNKANPQGISELSDMLEVEEKELKVRVGLR